MPFPGAYLRVLLPGILLLYSASYFAQQHRWQQSADYKMEVTLNDSLHTLHGFSSITYHNNSPHGLTYIYIHLWPNAYRSSNTALADQELRSGNTELYYAPEKDLGYIDSLRFEGNGLPLRWEYDSLNPDVCKVYLMHPLLTGDSVVISTPFFVKIPDARFSRLGHTGNAYYITQWYPKPAVFDQQGWHQMPYLDQGEFYSEFGKFDVMITLPDAYVLAATGDMQTESEKEFIRQKIARTETLLQSKTAALTDSSGGHEHGMKTVRFTQSDVHDFAWFADKRFLVLKDTVSFSSGHTVDTYVYFTPSNRRLWKDAARYVSDAVRFYSRYVGEYPYAHATAVDGTIMAGGGMEYPNITVIGNTGSALQLDMVITHEVGHNWFYGMLGSNERRFPFLDEGLNSFYELRYMREKYPNRGIAALVGLDSDLPLLGMNRVPLWKYHDLSYMLTQRLHTEQPPDLPADKYSSLNYGAVIYSRIAQTFDYLLQTAGPGKLDAAMKDYFNRYHFRHPQPEDLEQVLVEHGVTQPGVLHDLLHTTEPLDYKIISIKKNSTSGHELKIKNRGNVNGPFLLSALTRDSVLYDSIVEGFSGIKTISLSSGARQFVIDREGRMPEINRYNNRIRATGIFKKMRPLRFQFISGFEDPSRRQLFYMPLIGANYYNGFMAGMAFHNHSLLQKRFEWHVAPVYGFRSRSPAGSADFEFHFFTRGFVRQFNLGMAVKSFAFSDNSFLPGGEGFAHYYRLNPFLEMDIRKDPVSRFSQKILIRHYHMRADSSARQWDPSAPASIWNIGELKYAFDHRRAISPYSGELAVQSDGKMTKISGHLNFRLDINSKNNFMFRVFAGAFASGAVADRSFYAFRASGYNGYHDYTFSRYFYARSERSGIGFSQFAEEDGNLKVWTPLGQSSTWMTALNIKTPAFFRFPLRIFADVVVCDPFFLYRDQILWDAGLNLTILRDMVEVYYAFFYPRDIQRALDLNNVSQLNRLRFTFSIEKLVPKRIIREIGL